MSWFFDLLRWVASRGLLRRFKAEFPLCVPNKVGIRLLAYLNAWNFYLLWDILAWAKAIPNIEGKKTYYRFVYLQLLPVIRCKKQKQYGPAKLWIHFTAELFWKISVFESNQRPKRQQYCFEIKEEKSKIVRCEKITVDRMSFVCHRLGL